MLAVDNPVLAFRLIIHRRAFRVVLAQTHSGFDENAIGLVAHDRNRRHIGEWKVIEPAQRRAAERYGVVLNGRALAALVAQIQAGTAVGLGRRSRRVTYWRVTLPDGRAVPVVYDTARHRIVTFMPEGWTP